MGLADEQFFSINQKRNSVNSPVLVQKYQCKNILSNAATTKKKQLSEFSPDPQVSPGRVSPKCSATLSKP